MLAALLSVPSGGGIVVRLPFKKVGVRRLIVSCPYKSLQLNYDGVPIAIFNENNGFFEICFDSYYGFPDSTKFSFVNNDTVNHQLSVLVDYVPNSPLNSDYFERS